MKLKPTFILIIALVLVLTIGASLMLGQDGADHSSLSSGSVSAGETTLPEERSSQAPTEPGPEVFTLSFVGDCTLGCTDVSRPLETSFYSTVGENYDYPLANVRHIFEADDFTMANLEGPLTAEGTPADKQFVFRGSPAYTAILTGSSVEAVTIANNHFWDLGPAGEKATKAALEDAGIHYAGREGTFLYTTASGLTIGVYCDDFAFDRTHMTDSIASLRQQGAEIVVCAFHWGEERAYTPNLDQTIWAHTAIDAGADIVYGHHPHVLQPIEYYGSGVIFYSLGNFCYGGSITPSDKDSAIIQQQVIRDLDGSVSLGDTISIPCSISSVSDRNNYQPTPMTEGSAAYDRVMEKLAGTY